MIVKIKRNHNYDCKMNFNSYVKIKDISCLIEHNCCIVFNKKTNIASMRDITNFDEVLQKFIEFNKLKS